MGHDYRELFERPADDFESVVDQLVRERAATLQERRDTNLAIRVANAVNGARNVNGSGRSSSTSSTR